jgi:hypothetical protein
LIAPFLDSLRAGETMSMNTPVADRKPASAPRPLLPPEEKFWKRYSPHNEAPLSGVSSFLLHLLALLLLIGVVWLYSKMNPEEKNSSLPVETIRIGGGGGSLQGKDKGPGGSGEPGDPGGEDEQGSPDRPDKQPPPPEHQPLPEVQAQGIKMEFNNDEGIERLVERGTTQFKNLSNLEQEVRQQLRKSINPGVGGGRGKGTGQGPGEGPGKGNLNQREKRNLRWAMSFNTRDGNDYLNQLAGLGAMVAVPLSEKPPRFLLIRNLRSPEGAKEEDIASLNRIYWIDEKPDSVASLLGALGRSGPRYFVAFFPHELEKRLLSLELDELQRRYGTRDENKIHETKFDVYRHPDGRYDVRVSRIFIAR